MDFIHFTTEDSVDICEGDVVKTTNAPRVGPEGMLPALILCSRFFDDSQHPMLGASDDLKAVELGVVRPAPGILFRELFHLTENDNKCKMLCY